ncbi:MULTISPECIES: flagellar hook-basal body complex protein FliE [Hyphomicrobiales]|uniref:Flagellar hook-basal body complex protein FliE n=2 Tax=Prosthecodimorpha TaxID=2981530 RepID=A0A0P6VWH7_9HYPH|nr:MULTISPECIES: flagellar hook-basal body complex protein FliE [Hyphomicrobiales]KPL55687.1 flagellar hook-basal body protein FliE [Prosthecomicrobium hirschii]MBT9290580.1 flagellar hook-basal body complex protein FliE [Prosthecodimorpha staleyi]MCW1843990.1 flagellar hook-basal body complex protein FliE [Prosthecomicrobium hirschii]TPQ47356.1 flagellar hook-basal body protein FliE [Prosthecomicrobium hirschii]
MATIPANFAANAYKVAQGLANRPDQGHSPLADRTRPDFAGMVRDAMGDVVQQGRSAEAKTLAYAKGKADVIDVVTAVAETEVALETMVSLRDKVIAAYEEIMRMPV